MSTIFSSFFQNKPAFISAPAHVPYYEIRTRRGDLAGCISGTHHELTPHSRFEPAPTMQQCFNRATTLLVETDKEVVRALMRRNFLKRGITSKAIDQHFQEVDRNDSSIDTQLEKRAKTDGKPIQGLESPINAIKAGLKILKEEENTSPEQQEECLAWTRAFFNGAAVKTKDYFHLCFINRDTTLPDFFARNELMASGIAQSLRKKELPFVAVGFGHCLGEQGVPAILKEKYGLDVREVKPNPPSLVHVPISERSLPGNFFQRIKQTFRSNAA